MLNWLMFITFTPTCYINEQSFFLPLHSTTTTEHKRSVCVLEVVKNYITYKKIQKQLQLQNLRIIDLTIGT